jgi:hypothetical protein
MQADQFSVIGKTIVYLPMTMKCVGADRRNGSVQTLSANLSAFAMNLLPLGGSALSSLLFFLTDQPVDVRFNAASDSVFLSAVRQMTLGANLSALFVTTGDNVTTVLFEMVGGSGAQVTTSLPIP